MLSQPALLFAGGLVVVLVGAELLLRGASRLAALLGVRPIVVGLTVVALGTSAPELAVGITAAGAGQGALAVGNIAGANLLNILFILGLSACIRPVPLHLLSVKLDLAVMVASALALVAMAADGVLSRFEGVVLVAGGLAYTAALVRLSRRESAAMRREFAEEYHADKAMPPPDAALPSNRLVVGLWNLLLLGAGIAIAVMGAQLLVSGAGGIARAWGVSDTVIGLTIVAMGTAAPELATMLVATLRNDRDVAVGNVVGSCIYNVLVVLGLACGVAPGGIAVGPQLLAIDLPLAALVAIACLPVFRSGRRISRAEGALFVATYLLYLGSLLWLRT